VRLRWPVQAVRHVCSCRLARATGVVKTPLRSADTRLASPHRFHARLTEAFPFTEARVTHTAPRLLAPSTGAGFPTAPVPPPAPPAPPPPTVAAAVAPVQLNVNPMVLLSPAFYKALFNVNTADVSARLVVALNPFQTSHFLEIAGAAPDMYGPFWVAATLVFAIGASANMASWVNWTPAYAAAARGGVVTALWKYDFTLVTLALVTVYGWALGAPLVLWMALQYANVTALPLVTLVCAYGYSLAVFVPAAVRRRAAGWRRGVCARESGGRGRGGRARAAHMEVARRVRARRAAATAADGECRGWES